MQYFYINTVTEKNVYINTIIEKKCF